MGQLRTNWLNFGDLDFGVKVTSKVKGKKNGQICGFEQHNSKSYGPIYIKFSEKVRNEPTEMCLEFEWPWLLGQGHSQGQRPKIDGFVCVNSITKKVMYRFRWNFQERSEIGQLTID